jgi:hypothetical protein
MIIGFMECIARQTVADFGVAMEGMKEWIFLCTENSEAFGRYSTSVRERVKSHLDNIHVICTSTENWRSVNTEAN